MIPPPIILRVNQVSLAEQIEPHRRILSIHGPVGDGKWQHKQAQAIEYIESGKFAYYLFKDNRAVRLVVGRTATGEKFLKSEAEGEVPAMLLQQPSLSPAIN